MSLNSSLEVTSGMPISGENSFYANYTEEYVATYLHKVLQHPVYMVVLYSLAYVSIMICAIVGNVMVVAVVVRNQGMHTVTNYFIVNLAIADIMVALICLPITLLNNLYVDWHFGWFMCKATAYLQGVSVCASVTTLAAIAVDKYLAICHSWKKFKINKKVCKIIIVLIWMTAFAIMTPWAMYFKVIEYHDNERRLVYPVCYEHWPSQSGRKWFFLGALFLCCYSVPLILIVVCYLLIGIKVWRRRAPGEKTNSDIIHKSKVKAVKMLFVVVLLFAFSWLPLYVIRLQVIFSGPSQSSIYTIINPIAQWLGSSNSGMNPFIYCFFSKRYRRGFKDVITTCCRGREGRLQRRGLAATNAPFYRADSFSNGHSRHTRFSFVYDRNNTKLTGDTVSSYV